MAKKTTTSTSTGNPASLENLDNREDFITVKDQNTDELKLDQKAFIEKMPDLDFDHIVFVHSVMAEYMIKVADGMVKYMLDQLGPKEHVPTIPGLLKMFKQTFEIKDKNQRTKKPRVKLVDSYIPTIKEIELQAPGTMEDLLKAKFTFERNSHKNKAESMLSSINVGAAIATGRVNWDYAVQTYKETRENAEATFKEAVYAAYINEVNQIETRSSHLANEILMHQADFAYAVGISKAIDTYGKDIATANSGLSTAFASLSSDLVKQWNSMTQGETKLIVANRTDSLNLWTAIRAAYNKLFSGNRKI